MEELLKVPDRVVTADASSKILGFDPDNPQTFPFIPGAILALADNAQAGPVNGEFEMDGQGV